MTTESATSPAIPPPPEHQPLPQNSVNSSTPISAAPPSPPPPQITTEDIVNSNGILTDRLIDEELSFFKYLGSEEYADKYRRYEDEFKQYIVKKYLSGDDMYEEITTVDGETIYLSKWPSLASFADPVASFVDPVQCIVEDEEVEAEVGVEAEAEEEVEEVEEIEEVGEVEELGELEEASVDSASADIPNGELSNGGTLLEKKDNC